MISQFLYDYMHLVCLNVVRNMASDWNRAKSPAYIPGCFSAICSHMAACAEYVPSEFQRKCRSISDAKRWKATEARQFLLYTGIVVLNHLGLSSALYEHFLQLSVAIRCLCSPTLVSTAGFVPLARQLLDMFEASYGKLSGREQVTYKIHSLVHLVDDVERYGVLDNFSCFKFESYLGAVKELVHKRRTTNIVQQICRGLSERDYMIHDGNVLNRERPDSGVTAGPHARGPTLSEMGSVQQYEVVRWQQHLLGCTQGNRCFLMNSEIYLIENVVTSKDNCTWLLRYKFLSRHDLFTLPFKTDGIPKENILKSGRLGIWTVSNLTDELVAVQLTNSFQLHKCMQLPIGDTVGKFAAITMLHDS
jgi:hypothetical protein